MRRNRPEDQMDVRGRRRRRSTKDLASNAAVAVARLVCIVAGLAALGVGLVGMLAGTGLGPWGAGIGGVLLLIGLPWTWISAASVAGAVAVLFVIGAAS
jgi:hypothetical protein